MRIKINRDLTYVDCIVKSGTRATALDKKEVYRIESEETRAALTRARYIYNKRGIRGVFALLKGKYRFVYERDYK